MIPPSPLAGKVFGIGLARTGTTSLHYAMLELGLRSAPNSLPLLDRLDLDFVANHDAFFDNPIPFRYRDLDAACRNSYWIVTHRPLEPWLRSMRWLFGPGMERLDPQTRAIGDQVHRRLYGIDAYDETVLTRLHIDHYRTVRDWSANRQALWLETEAGLSWEPICELLQVPRPTVSFPHQNRAKRSRRPPWRRR